jgi:hypothetical protein
MNSIPDFFFENITIEYAVETTTNIPLTALHSVGIVASHSTNDIVKPEIANAQH